MLKLRHRDGQFRIELGNLETCLLFEISNFKILTVTQDKTKLIKALHFANACRAITLTKRGSIMPMREEVEEFMKDQS